LVDTTGFSTGTFALSLSGTEIGADTAFVQAGGVEEVPTITNGTITVNAVNHAPVAVDDTASTNEDMAISINVVANDQDPENDLLSVAGLQTTGTTGSVTLNGDRTVQYNPNGQFESLRAG